MKKIIIFINFVFFVTFSISSNTIYTNKSCYDVFFEFMNEHFDYSWPGRSYNFYEDNNEKSIFIIILGDYISDEIVKKNFNISKKELETLTKQRDLVYEISYDEKKFIISTTSLKKLKYYLKNREHLIKSLKNFINPNSNYIHNFNSESYKKSYIGEGVFFNDEKNIFSKILKLKPNPKNDYYWPFYIYIPKKVKINKKTYLLVFPSVSHKQSNNMMIHDNDSYNYIRSNIDLSESLGVILLIPVFPRPSRESLDYGILALNRKTIIQDEYKELVRVDNQLIKMIEELKYKLNNRGIDIEDKILMEGFSGSAQFINRFSILHPEIIKAASIGAAGGYMVPVEEYKGQKLRYPVGVSDFKEINGNEFNEKNYNKIIFFFYMGEKDNNDPAAREHGEQYEEVDLKLIKKYLGHKLLDRFKIVNEIIKSKNENCIFKIYKNIGHQKSSEINEDIKKFFIKVIKEKYDNEK